MKKIALKQYLNLKKKQDVFKEKTIIYENSDFLEKNDLTKLLNSNNNEVLKPMYKDNNYYVVKLLKKVTPQVLPYKKVKSEIELSYIKEQTSKKLNTLAKESMKNFSGKNLGFLSTNSIPIIKGLNDDEIAKLIENIFSSKKATNFIAFDSKIAIYKITNSKLIPYNKSNDETIISTLKNIKANTIASALLEKLKTRYNIKSYMKSN
jgi:peptidyl-prolyl cis-trans isomerase D